MIRFLSALPDVPTPKAPGVLAAASQQQRFWWVPIAIGAIQSILALALTYYIFRNNSKQKVAERKVAWFHKVAVDPSIEKCFAYFGPELNVLETAALECESLKYVQQDEVALGVAVKARLKDFKGRLRPVRNGASDLAMVFDAELRQSIFDRFNQFEDDVSNWFDKLQSSGASDPRASLPNMVTSCQSDVFRILREHEFKIWTE
jgi:hypothetical protein